MPRHWTLANRAAMLVLGLRVLGPPDAQARAEAAPVPPGTQAIPASACPPPIVACPPTVIRYAPTVSFLPGPYGLYPYAPPIVVTSGPVLSPPAVPPPPIVVGVGPGPILPPPPRFIPAPAPIDPLVMAARQGGMAGTEQRGDAPLRSPEDEDRMAELLTFGDRNFRVGDLRRAERRYRQAMAASPLSAEPRARLSEVAFVRGQYGQAANLLREAITAEPDWLARARDVQSLFAEPADFHAPLSALEAHLQASPDDRDGWMVLGTQLLLSGRVERAADVFLRLADRRPDAALTVLMEASGLDR